MDNPSTSTPEVPSQSSSTQSAIPTLSSDRSDFSSDSSSPSSLSAPAPAPAAVAPAAVAPSPALAPVPVVSDATPTKSSTEPIASVIKENLTNVKEKVMESVTNPMSGGFNVVTSLSVGAAIAFFVAFVLYWVITYGSNPLLKKTYQIPETKLPKTGYEVNQISTENMPSVKDLATLSFWLYVNEFPEIPSSGTQAPSVLVRHVWHRGNPKWTTSPEIVGPLVLLKSEKAATGAQKNKLLISFKSSDVSKLLDGESITNRLSKIDYMVATRGIEINYVPVKRWVHIAVTVNKKNKIMRAYVDGENVKTIDNSQIVKVTTTIDAKRKLTDTDINGAGDIFIGGRPTSDLGLGFPGLVSNIRMSNWDMTSAEVYREYKRGPVDNLLARLGLPAYGVQSPVYKM